MAVLIPIRVTEGHEVEVVHEDNVLVLVGILEELIGDVGDGGRADPLSGVNATMNPDCGLPDAEWGW